MTSDPASAELGTNLSFEPGELAASFNARPRTGPDGIGGSPARMDRCLFGPGRLCSPQDLIVSGAKYLGGRSFALQGRACPSAPARPKISLFTLGAVRILPPVLLRTAWAMRQPPWHATWWVLVPAWLPAVVNGLRVGFSLSLPAVLIGEVFSSQRGLGFLLVSGLAQQNVRLTTAVALAIVAGAVLANALMLRLGRQITHQG